MVREKSMPKGFGERPGTAETVHRAPDPSYLPRQCWGASEGSGQREDQRAVPLDINMKLT